VQIFDTLFIGNEYVKPESGDVIDVVSPHTEQVIGQVPDASPADIDKAVAAARDAFDNGPWPTMPPKSAARRSPGSRPRCRIVPSRSRI